MQGVRAGAEKFLCWVLSTQGDILEYYQFYNDLVTNKISHLIRITDDTFLASIPGAK